MAFFLALGGALLGVGAPLCAGGPLLNPRYAGLPFMQVWETDELGALPVNSTVVQDPQSGFIYVANNAGVLEYDGVRWELITLPDRKPAVLLAVDRRGRVWFTGGSGMIGRLEPAPGLRTRAVSVRDREPADDQRIGLIVGVLATPDGVYFAGRLGCCFFPDGDNALVQFWPLPAPAASIWWMDGAVHMAMENGIWVRLEGGKVYEVARGRPTVFAVQTLAGEGTQWLTPRGVWRGEAGWTDPAGPLAKSPAINAVVLADGRLAFGTVGQGLLLYDANGRLLQRIDRKSGLLSNRVQGLFEDREGGLWLALHRGLARIQLDSPFAVHQVERQGFGEPAAITRIADRLYVVHTEGLAAADADGQFRPVTAIPGGIGQLLGPAHDAFLSAALERLDAPTSGNPRPENPAYNGVVSLSTAPGMFALGGARTVWLCRVRGEGWERVGRLAALRRRAKPRLEAPAGILWITAGTQLQRVDFRGGVNSEAPVRDFGEAEGLWAGSKELFLLDGELVVRGGDRAVRYDPVAERFVPDSRLVGYRGDASLIPVGVDSEEVRWFSRSLGWPRPTNWIAGLYRLTRSRPDRWEFEEFSPAIFAQENVTRVYHDVAARTRWVGGHGGLISMDLDWQPAHREVPLVALIRRVESLDRETVAAGPWDFSRSSLRFVFGAPSFVSDLRGRTNLRFRTRIDGVDAEWRPWSGEAFREVSGLPSGHLRLRVQVRDHAGRESSEAVLAFAIPTPWWRTGWAVAGGIMLSGLAVTGVVRWRTRTHRRRTAALEAVIADRTAALHVQNLELSRLHRLDRDENASLRHAEEKLRLEVLRYQLNPHFLYNSLNSIYGLLFENPPGAAEMVLRLSDFCRATLTVNESARSTLGDELRVLRTYLDVEKIRWGEGLEVEITVTPAAEAWRLPPFLLLPLVENAIKYGGRTSPGTLRLRLSARQEAKAAIIEIANSGTWVAPNASRGDSTGLGIENLRQRLGRYFPAAHEFHLGPEGDWVVARLRLTAGEEAERDVPAPPCSVP